MKFILTVLLASGVLQTLVAADVSFDVQPRLLTLGESATATFTFHDMRSAPQVEFPRMDGITVASSGESSQFGTGMKPRVSKTYSLYFSKAGSHTVGPFSMTLDGKTVDLPAVTVEVRPPAASVAAGGEAAALQVEFELVGGGQPFVQQPFTLVMAVYSLPEIQLAGEINLLGGIPDGIRLAQIEEMGMDRADKGGIVYNRRRFRMLAVANQPGRYAVAPVIRVGVVEAQQRSRDPFGGMFENPFFGRQQVTPHTLAAPEKSVEVRSIPTPAPAGYGGAIGNFELTATVGPRELAVGEPVTFSMTLKGMGNISTVPLPSYEDTAEYKTYAARQVGNAPDPSAISGERTIEQVIIPRVETLTELPALELPVFNTARGEYTTLRVGPFPLKVNPAANGANAMLLQIPGGDAAGSASLVLGTDIVYLKAAPVAFCSRTEPVKRGLGWLYLLPPLGCLASWRYARRKEKLAGNQAFARRQKAPRAARAGLKQARAALQSVQPDARVVFGALVSAATHYFAHRLNLPLGAADENLILQKLRSAGAPEEAYGKWQEFFSAAAGVRYAGTSGMGVDELRQWVDVLAELLRQAERLRLE